MSSYYLYVIKSYFKVLSWSALGFFNEPLFDFIFAFLLALINFNITCKVLSAITLLIRMGGMKQLTNGACSSREGSFASCSPL